jgi:hypothetical protein
MQALPHAGSGTPEEISKIRRVVESRGLVGAANNTKWNELISFIRGMNGWRPSYRTKVVEGQISKWDVEWFYHLPFPLICVEWLDIGLKEERRVGRLGKPDLVDHAQELSEVLRGIGFDFEVRGHVARIWGHLPKSMEDFPPTDA